MEAIILAGGKAERLGEAAGGRPKALIELAGRPLAAYQVEQLAAAGVTRVLTAGEAYYFSSHLPHRFKNVGREACEIISASTPPSF